MTVRTWMSLAALVAALPCPAPACTFCQFGRQTPTFRREAAHPDCQLIVIGSPANPRFLGDRPGAGLTDFHVKHVLQAAPGLDPKLAKKSGDVVELQCYLPIPDPKAPPRMLLFCRVEKGRLDPYRAITLGPGKVAYFKGALALAPGDSTAALAYFFNYLDHPDAEVAGDAFAEFAWARDHEVGAAARRFSAAKLRAWLAHEKTPPERLGLYAFLLGACGGKEDLAWFERLLDEPGERWERSYDGLLSGYIQLRPAEGWKRAVAILGDTRVSWLARLGAMRSLRFYYAWTPRESREPVLRAMRAAVRQGELIDRAAEELRNWRMWDLTADVLAQYGREGLEAPMHRSAIIRYALCCPDPKARAFVERVRQQDPDTVKDLEQSLAREGS